MASSKWAEWDQLLNAEEVDALEVLRLGAKYQRYLAAVQREAIRVARASGRSWTEIASALGLTRQAVWQRFRFDLNLDPEAARQWIKEGTQPLRFIEPPLRPE